MIGAAQAGTFRPARADTIPFAVIDQTTLAEPHVPGWGVPFKLAALACGVALTWTPILLAVRSIVSH